MKNIKHSFRQPTLVNVKFIIYQWKLAVHLELGLSTIRTNLFHVHEIKKPIIQSDPTRKKIEHIHVKFG